MSNTGHAGKEFLFLDAASVHSHKPAFDLLLPVEPLAQRRMTSNPKGISKLFFELLGQADV